MCAAREAHPPQQNRTSAPSAGRIEQGRIEHKVRRFVRALAGDPVETLRYVPEHLSMRGDRPPVLDVDESWEQHLHGLLGAAWPCPDAPVASEIWSAVAAELAARELALGRNTYRGYSDGDLAFARAAWCTARHLRPTVVVETGVARGVTTRFILEALVANAHGHLWSVDLPHPFDPDLHAQTAAAVPSALRPRWTYVRGSSRSRLPSVLRSVGTVDVFVHDSLHTA